MNDVKFVYVDDSGRPQSGLVVYGWVEFSSADWQAILRSWLDFRKRLWRQYKIPVDKELHTTEYANGRSEIAKTFPDEFRATDGTPYKKDFGQHIAKLCLQQIGSMRGMRVGAIYRQADPANLAQTRTDLYRCLVNDLQQRMGHEQSQAQVFMDGEDDTYRHVHRELKLHGRRILEDPVMLSSKYSQLIQIADLVAWSAYSSINKHASQEFAWHWYRDFLAARDPNRSPLER